jgi:DNA-binding transcriptional LysR family regulator
VPQQFRINPAAPPPRTAFLNTYQYAYEHATCPLAPAAMQYERLSCRRHRGKDGGKPPMYRQNRRSHRSLVGAGSLTVSHCDVAIDAAKQGVGIAFVLESWAKSAIKAKRLIPLLEEYLPSFPGLRISYSSRTPVTSTVLAVIETLLPSKDFGATQSHGCHSLSRHTVSKVTRSAFLIT